MSAEFNWWLLIVGVVAGAALTWLVVADSGRREREISERELPAEATWISRSVGSPGVDAETAELVLRAHRRYLGFPPPDMLIAPEELDALQDGRTANADPESSDAGADAPREPAVEAPPVRAERGGPPG